MQLNSDPNERSIYKTFEKFKEELYYKPEYVPPGYEIGGWGDVPQVPDRESGDNKRSGSAGDEPPDIDDRADGPRDRNQESAKGRADQNAKEKLLEMIDRGKPSVTLVTGESGIGKTRLLAEVGRALADRRDVEAWYTRARREVREPPTYRDKTVLFLDEVGRMDDPEQFFRLSSATHRERGTNSTVHVVASIRPVYLDDRRERDVPSGVDRRVIELQTLDEDGSLELLSSTGVSTETARSIHAATDGNPFLSWLLANAERTDGVNIRPQEKIREIIDETMLKEAEVLQANTDSVRLLLKAISILGEYDVADEAEEKAVIEFCDGLRGGQHDKALSKLIDTNYIVSVKGADSTDGTAFAHKYDVFAEYLRLDALVNEGRQYERFVSRCPASSLSKIAEGLVELHKSTLRRLEFFREEGVRAEVREQLKTMALRIIDADASLEDVFAVQTSAARVAPDVIPHSKLERRYENGTPGVAVAEHMSEFVSVLYRRASNETDAEGSSRTVGATADDPDPFESAQMWLARLDDLAETYPDHEGIQLGLARTLSDAANDEGEAGRFNSVQDRLDRLEDLAAGHPDHEDIQLQLAIALNNVAYYEGEAGRFKSVQDRLDRLEDLAASHPDHEDIQLGLARTLSDAAYFEGEARRLGAVQDRLDRLEGLAAGHPDHEDIQLDLARTLSDAAHYEGEAGRLGAVQDRLDRLEDLAAGHPDHEDIQLQLANALANAANDEGEAGRFKSVQHRLDRLEDLAKAYPDHEDIQLQLANALLYVAGTEGQAGRLGAVQDRLDRLENLAEVYPDHEDIQLQLAIALNNVAYYEGEAGRFKSVQHRLDRLEDLAKAYPDHEDIQLQLANALLYAVGTEGQAGRFESVQTRLDRLEDLTESNRDYDTIRQNTMSAYVVYIGWLTEKEEYEAANKAITALDESSSALGRVSFRDETNTDSTLQQTATNLLQAEQVSTLERLLAVLRTRGNDQHVDSICADVMTESEQLLDGEEISLETYERVESMCAEE